MTAPQGVLVSFWMRASTSTPWKFYYDMVWIGAAPESIKVGARRRGTMTGSCSNVKVLTRRTQHSHGWILKESDMLKGAYDIIQSVAELLIA